MGALDAMLDSPVTEEVIEEKKAGRWWKKAG
jgi:hypothetical protein